MTQPALTTEKQVEIIKQLCKRDGYNFDEFATLVAMTTCFTQNPHNKHTWYTRCDGHSIEIHENQRNHGDLSVPMIKNRLQQTTHSAAAFAAFAFPNLSCHFQNVYLKDSNGEWVEL